MKENPSYSVLRVYDGDQCSSIQALPLPLSSDDYGSVKLFYDSYFLIETNTHYKIMDEYDPRKLEDEINGTTGMTWNYVVFLFLDFAKNDEILDFF